MSTSASTDQFPTVALRLPPNYDLGVAEACSFFVNVACDMCKQWIAQGSPAPAAFSWTPADPCPYTSEFSVSDYTFSSILWSTFTDNDGTNYTEPFGFVATSGDTAYLAFRGSQTAGDAKLDGEFAQVAYTSPLEKPPSGMMVEKGFYAVFNGLLDSLTTELQAAKGKTLLITGHSLGSTLATLAVPVAVSLGFSGTQYNQASPRVGNLTFATYVGELSIPTFRLVNIYDAVPKLPPSMPGAQYQAVGPEASYGADYPTEAEKHDPCCSYSYALYNGKAPYNPNMKSCMTSS